MSSLSSTILEAQGRSDVVVRPPSGLPEAGLIAPIEELYSQCGGIDFLHRGSVQVSIVSPSGYQRSNATLLGEEHPVDRSHHWFIFATFGTNFLSIDTALEREARIYDSFWDVHAVAGSCRVLADGPTDFIRKVLKSRKLPAFWLEEDFIALGDAYD